MVKSGVLSLMTGRVCLATQGVQARELGALRLPEEDDDDFLQDLVGHAFAANIIAVCC